MIRPASAQDAITIHRLGTTDYVESLARMRRHTAARAVSGKRAEFVDEIWLTEHPPVFTLGVAGNTRHLHDPGEIPVVATERGGQITYHGPGQVLAYLMLDLRRRRIGVRDLVCRIEAGVIGCLAVYGIAGIRRDKAPGLYVRKTAAIAKIASIGLKVSQGLCYHGVALNGRMDLEPFDRIDPCGFPGLAITDVYREAGTYIQLDLASLADRLGDALAAQIER